MPSKINPLIQWWVTPRLPAVHIFIPPNKRPKGLGQIFRVYSRKWLLHPVKRRVAKYYLLLLQKFFGLKVIGITGSAGKTTTKEMVAAILKQKGETVWSYANIDPVYNLPTTILKCKTRTKYLVLEMGVEFPGEMDYYLWLAKPAVGVITNIYPTHIEFFGNTKGVAAEKVKLIQSLSKESTAVLNKENTYTSKFERKTKAGVIWFGKEGDVQAKNVKINRGLKTKYTLQINSSKTSVELPLPGDQFVSNSLAAAAIGCACGISIGFIKKGLENFDPAPHRMELSKLPSGTLLIDDSYNNNPVAAIEALKVLRKIAGKRKKIVVFGDMLELGKHERRYHQQMGEKISSFKIDCLIGVGKAAKVLVDTVKKDRPNGKFFWVEKVDEVDPILVPFLQKETVFLIKGSRSLGLDKLVSRLSP